MRIKITAIAAALVCALSLSACGGSDSGHSEKSTAVINGTELDKQGVAVTSIPDVDEYDSMIGGWRALELERGSDTETNESFKYVLLLNNDGTYCVTYEEPRKYEFSDEKLLLYHKEGSWIEYIDYSIKNTDKGYIIRPVGLMIDKKYYTFEHVEEEYKKKVPGKEYTSDVPDGIRTVNPSYMLIPYDGQYKDAEEEYKQSLEIIDLKSLNLWAKTVFIYVNTYFNDRKTDKSTYCNYAGKYTINDTDNEFSKGISETLSENKNMNMECCIIVVWNEEWDRYDYYVQTRADGHNQIGQYPEPRSASFSNPALSSDIVYGTYTKLEGKEE